MTAIIAFFLGPIGRWVGIGVIALMAIGGVYEKGRFDQRSYDKAKLQREISDAIEKGNDGAADALRKFDAGGLPDGWFRD